MCFVCEASSRNIIYSVPKPMKKYWIPWMIIRHIEKCFSRSSDTNAYLIDEQDNSFEFQSNIYQKVGLKSLSQSAIKSSSSARFMPVSPRDRGFIATNVALHLTIKHLWLIWHIWQMKVFADTAKMFILTSDAKNSSVLHFYFSLSN